MSKFLGIDLGTQSLKALIYDADRRKVSAAASCELPLRSGADGAREQEAAWWLDALGKAVGRLNRRERRAVRAIGVSGQQHGFVPVGAAGTADAGVDSAAGTGGLRAGIESAGAGMSGSARVGIESAGARAGVESTVLAPVKLWCDTATAAECDAIEAAFGGRRQCIKEVGNPILPGYTASKILWLKRHRPADYRAMRTILLPHDYLNFHLTGEKFMECGDASGTGLLDIRARDWHPGMLQAVDGERDLRECLPPLIEPGTEGGRLRPAAAAELGLPPGIPVAPGGGDNMMAALATGNVAPGRLTMSLGTSGTLFAYFDAPCIDDGGELAAFCSSTGGWLPLWCTMNCTVATELARGLLRMSVKAFDASVAATPPGAEGVAVLPFYQGERAPNLPRGKGCIMGLTSGNMSQGNINRASMEAAVYGLRRGLDAFRRADCPAADIRLTGGGARSPVWRQMIADNFRLPVRVLRADEGAALGAALNAMLLGSPAYGDPAKLAAAVDEHIRFAEESAEPDAKAAADYDESYARYLSYLEQMRPMFE